MTDKELLAAPVNTWERVRYREALLDVQRLIELAIEQWRFPDLFDQCTLSHYFAPMRDEYGCYQYTRLCFMPAGALVVGKIHRHSHVNFILKGRCNVSTEYGKEQLEAPCVFVSAAGTKRLLYTLEDTLWSTVHMVKHSGLENLAAIEDEVFAKRYSDIGFIESTAELQRLQDMQRGIAA